MPRRSLLFSPGDDEAMLTKALGTAADGVVFDLEDAVAPAAKDAARATVRSVLDGADDSPAEVWVRVNPLARGGDDDLDAVLSASNPPDCVVVPMVADRGDVERVAARVDQRAPREVGLVALVETAAGLVNADAVAAHPSVTAVAFGAEDFRADVAASPRPDGRELDYARGRVVVAARAAGVDVIDTVYTDIEDPEGLAAAAELARDLGYDGKAAIHPAQVPVINEAFAPDPERVAWARRVVDAEREADAAGRGAFRVDGEMVDEPVLRRARAVLDRTPEDADR